MPTSEAQLRANRRNAQKSTGPATPEGRQKSARNAFRHGLTGQIAVQTAEDRQALHALTNDFLAHFKPEGPEELQLTIAIAEHHWRLNRIRAAEENILSLCASAPEPDTSNANTDAGSATDPDEAIALNQAQTLLDHARDFERFSLYESRVRRNLEKDRAQLKQLQTERAAARASALLEAARHQCVDEHYRKSIPAERRQNGFVFSTPEVKAEIRRVGSLERFTFHDERGWNPESVFFNDRFPRQDPPEDDDNAESRDEAA